jgi:hypothetical protein
VLPGISCMGISPRHSIKPRASSTISFCIYTSPFAVTDARLNLTEEPSPSTKAAAASCCFSVGPSSPPSVSPWKAHCCPVVPHAVHVLSSYPARHCFSLAASTLGISLSSRSPCRRGGPRPLSCHRSEPVTGLCLVAGNQ